MELLVRIRWRHTSPADLRCDVEPYHTVADLLAAASAFCDAPWEPSQPVYHQRSGNQLRLDASIRECGLVSGDTLRFEVYGAEFGDTARRSESVSCDVTAGPEAGRSFVLEPGKHEVGRGTECAVRLEDPTVSHHQLSIAVFPDLTVQLIPHTTASNPLTVNGRTISEPTFVSRNDVVQFGATAVALRVFSRSSDTERDQLGQVPFRRTPYKPVVVRDRKFTALGRIPTKPEKTKMAAAPIVAPIIMGLAMYAFTKSPYMLMMMALSPAMVIFNQMGGRKTNQQRYTTQVEELHQRIAKRRAELESALIEERAERIDQSPDLADLARRATLRTLDLWPRQRGDEEFLRTRLGLGTVRSRVTVEQETSGDDELCDLANAAMAGHDRLPAVPICVNLGELGVFGLHGAHPDVIAMCSSVLIQAATLHSPEDLVIAVIEGRDTGLGTWAKWLPHTRSATSPVAGSHLTHDPDGAADLVRQLVAVARMRTGAIDRADHRWPWILVVLDESADVDPALVSQLLELCPQAGISVLVAVELDARIPRQAKATFRCVPSTRGALSSVWYTEPQTPSEEFEPEPANARLIDQVAMSLAPLRDATSASATTAIPRIVPLLSLFGPEPPTPLSVTSTWSARKPYGLRAPIGMGPSGPLFLDLVEHGPHALIGGTSGAGKSELLQSIVAALIHEYPPSRLTFLFVDYKGGAATEVFNTVPHTVGYVTNLDASLSLRALTSLRAELNHRMRLMEGKAKDLAEMLEKYPDEAPPSLVIVVDEFATLVKEVPEFVAGVVDIAQRGRSLGVHLILATQRPSGSVNDNILANTNLRISLRMLDGSESRTVIGVPSAADIALPLKGRGFAKLGPSDLIEFQSAYTGAALTQEAEVSPVTVRGFGSLPTARVASRTPAPHRPTAAIATGTPPAAAPAPGFIGGSSSPPQGAPLPPPMLASPAHDSAPPEPPAPSPIAPTPAGQPSTHLDVLLDAVRKAAVAWPSPRKPWREMLPEELDWFSIERPEYTSAPGRRGRYLTLGMLDDPAAQAQHPATFDLEDGGGLIIGGSGGSGKTTAMRTAALSAIIGATPDEVTLFVIDCSSRALVPLMALPHVAAVATGDDIESVTRVITLLAAELDRRRPLLTDLDVQAENLSAYLDKGHSMPRIVVLVDGFQNLPAILGVARPSEHGPLDWGAEFQRIVTDGRQMGIHVVIAADRRQAIPPLLMSAIGNRLVLRQTDDGGYIDYGIPAALSKGLELPNGRGLCDNRLVQVGLVSKDATAAAQGAAIAEFAARLGDTAPTSLRSGPPPDVVRVPLKARDPESFTLGRTDVFGALVEVSVRFSGLCVTGPPRSGRTTALRHAARSLVAAGYEVWTVGLGDGIGGPGRHASAKSDAMLGLVDEFATLCETFPRERPYVLVVDDIDRYELTALDSAYDRILKAETSRLIGSIETRNMSGYTPSTMLSEVRREPSLLFLQPDGASEVVQYVGVRPNLRPGFKLTAGRGVLIMDRQPHVVMVGSATE
jgi:S-DNA-T family DNA segregation ATPase FtsK/SpoIIIE